MTLNRWMFGGIAEGENPSKRETNNNYNNTHTLININNTLILYSSFFRNRISVLLILNYCNTPIYWASPSKSLEGC